MREIHLEEDQFKSFDEMTNYLEENYTPKEVNTYLAIVQFVMSQESMTALSALLKAIYPDEQDELNSPHDMVKFLYNNVLREASEKDRLRFLAEMVDE